MKTRNLLHHAKSSLPWKQTQIVYACVLDIFFSYICIVLCITRTRCCIPLSHFAVFITLYNTKILHFITLFPLVHNLPIKYISTAVSINMPTLNLIMPFVFFLVDLKRKIHIYKLVYGCILSQTLYLDILGY